MSEPNEQTIEHEGRIARLEARDEDQERARTDAQTEHRERFEKIDKNIEKILIRFSFWRGVMWAVTAISAGLGASIAMMSDMVSLFRKLKTGG